MNRSAPGKAPEDKSSEHATSVGDQRRSNDPILKDKAVSFWYGSVETVYELYLSWDRYSTAGGVTLRYLGWSHGSVGGSSPRNLIWRVSSLFINSLFSEMKIRTFWMYTDSKVKRWSSPLRTYFLCTVWFTPLFEMYLLQVNECLFIASDSILFIHFRLIPSDQNCWHLLALIAASNLFPAKQTVSRYATSKYRG